MVDQSGHGQQPGADARSPQLQMNKSTASSSVCIIGLNVHCTVGYRRLKLVLALLGLLGKAVSSPGGEESKYCWPSPAAGPARPFSCRRWGCGSVAVTLQELLAGTTLTSQP